MIFKDGRELKEYLDILSGESINDARETVILTDNDMPYFKGLDLIQRYSGETPCSKFILLTGNDEIGEEQVFQAGGYKLLRKPVRIAEIENTVRSAFRELE